MGKIVISENVTLDGVVQDPTGEEGSDLRKFCDEQGHYLRERHRALCGTLLNPRTIYRRVTSRFFIHGCSMTKNLLLGSIAGNFLRWKIDNAVQNPHVSHRALPEVWAPRSVQTRYW